MDWLYFAMAAPIVPVIALMGAWFFVRHEAPARGMRGLSCDGHDPTH